MISVVAAPETDPVQLLLASAASISFPAFSDAKTSQPLSALK